VNTYYAFGQDIHSELSLPELTSHVSETPSLSLRTGPLTPEMNAEEGRGARFRGIVPGVARFFFDRGETVFIEPAPSVPLWRLRLSVLGSAMAIALRQKGLMVLHGSSVVAAGKAYLFVGRSGSGKSTLADELSRHAGVGVLSDDVTAIDFPDGAPFVHSSFPSLRICAGDAGTRSGVDEMFVEGIKRRISVKEKFVLGSFPLGGILFLNFGPRMAITPVPGVDALADLSLHSRGIPPLDAPEILRTHLHQMALLIRSEVVFRLDRPRDLSLIEGVTDALLSWMEGRGDSALYDRPLQHARVVVSADTV
jgi:hypothetical protein